jgi:hypothetical protein
MSFTYKFHKLPCRCIAAAEESMPFLSKLLNVVQAAIMRSTTASRRMIRATHTAMADVHSTTADIRTSIHTAARY